LHKANCLDNAALEHLRYNSRQSSSTPAASLALSSYKSASGIASTTAIRLIKLKLKGLSPVQYRTQTLRP